jgi:hypothetical protein
MNNKKKQFAVLMKDDAGEQYVIPAVAGSATAAGRVAMMANPSLVLMEVFPFNRVFLERQIGRSSRRRGTHRSIEEDLSAPMPSNVKKSQNIPFADEPQPSSVGRPHH